MAQKPNNGGTQDYAPAGATDENGNPIGGQFIGDGEATGSADENEDELTDADIDEFIMDSDYADMFGQMDDDGKNKVREFVRSQLEAMSQSSKLDVDFDNVTEDEFEEYGKESEEYIKNTYGSDAQSLFTWFYSKYRGNPRSFDLNKALRLGYDNALDWFNEAMASADPALARYQSKVKAFPSREEIDEFANAFDKLTSSFTCPKDMAVYRFVNDDVIVSWFKDTMVKAGISVKKGIFGYEVSGAKDVPLDDLVNILKNSVGRKVEGDKGFSSFSTVESMSHMRSSTDEDFRRIKIVYDLPKGQKCFISQYHYESEGVLPRGLSFVIKSVDKQTDEYGERAVIRIGILQKK